MVRSGAMQSTRLSPEDALRTAERAAEFLARDPRVRLVYLFGSAADRRRAAFRDVDLAIVTTQPLTIDELLGEKSRSFCRTRLTANGRNRSDWAGVLWSVSPHRSKRSIDRLSQTRNWRVSCLSPFGDSEQILQRRLLLLL